LRSVKHNPEAVDLLRCLLKIESDKRGEIKRLQSHPIFWNSGKRLRFICRVSDKIVASESEQATKTLLEKFGKCRFEIFDKRCKWDACVNEIVINANANHTYDKESLSSLLKLIRNRVHHHLEDPYVVKKFLKQQNGIEPYFRKCFLTMVMTLYHAVINSYGVEEEDFAKFFT
jgi:serine/threonine-protein kinase/endoribonuclease IRE1